MNVAQKIKPKTPAALYDRDFVAWLTEQVDALRSRDLARLDVANLLDEVDSLGRAEKNAIESHLAVLIADLWKWQLQPGRRSRSWGVLIVAQRAGPEARIRRSPSLRNTPAETFDGAAGHSRTLVLRVAGL